MEEFFDGRNCLLTSYCEFPFVAKEDFLENFNFGKPK